MREREREGTREIVRKREGEREGEGNSAKERDRGREGGTDVTPALHSLCTLRLYVAPQRAPERQQSLSLHRLYTRHARPPPRARMRQWYAARHLGVWHLRVEYYLNYNEIELYHLQIMKVYLYHRLIHYLA